MHNFKKKYGQNFLRNEEILDRIINSFDVKNNGVIVEVGPGDGALTRKLLLKKTPVICFEIDESLKEYLDSIKDFNLKIIYKDFLSINLEDYFDRNITLYFASNVPYYITTPIITKFIDSNFIPEVMVMMVQKEVAQRLTAKPGNSEYGAISVLLNYYFDIEYLFDVDRTNFYPVPNVDSAVIKLVKKDNILKLNDYDKFKKIINDSFKQKRKNLRNNLKNYDLASIESILKNYNLDLTNRAEDLTYEVFVDLANNN